MKAKKRGEKICNQKKPQVQFMSEYLLSVRRKQINMVMQSCVSGYKMVGWCASGGHMLQEGHTLCQAKRLTLEGPFRLS